MYFYVGICLWYEVCTVCVCVWMLVCDGFLEKGRCPNHFFQDLGCFRSTLVLNQGDWNGNLLDFRCEVQRLIKGTVHQFSKSMNNHAHKNESFFHCAKHFKDAWIFFCWKIAIFTYLWQAYWLKNWQIVHLSIVYRCFTYKKHILYR